MEQVRAIWDNEVSTYVCPQCYHPMDYDGIWQEDDDILDLWACHDCALEFYRPTSDKDSAPLLGERE